MKRLIINFVCLTVCFAGTVKNYTELHEKGDRFFSFPGDGDNTLHLVDTWEPVEEDFIRDYTNNPANNGYWLFTRANPTNAQFLMTNDSNSITTSFFNRSNELIFLVHGWYGHGGNDLNQLLTQAFLEVKDANVIVVDWSKLARRNYLTAKSGIGTVGTALGQFISWLAEFGVSYDKVHLVGFSLGAHLVGKAGRETGSRIKRITALDPAGPLWGKDENRIVPTDAQYVEVIHTNTALFGFSDPCGDTDFYPNGGSSMPGCWLNMCSHSRSYEYMAASVKYDHLYGKRCNTSQIDYCSGDLFPMGNSDLLKEGSGIFLVSTGEKYPF